MFHKQFSLFTGSTGLGKTEILIALIKRSIEARSDIKVCFIVNKLGLLSQTVSRIQRALGDVVSVYSGKEKDLTKQIVVASIQSLHKRNVPFNLVILDEAHNVNQTEGMYYKFISNLAPKTKVVACTATPFRADGYIYGEDKWFNKPCFSKGLEWSIENKFLVPPTCKRVKEKFDTRKLKIRMGDYDMASLNELVSDKDKLVSQVEDALPQLTGRHTIIWACINIKHAEAITAILTAAGEDVSILHSKQDNAESSYNKYMFECGIHRHLVFVTIVSEGYDHPPIDAVVLMRPTRSPIMYIQVIGRGLRLSEGKNNCLVLDYGGVIENLGPLHDPVISTKKKNKKGVIEIKMKFCTHCYEYCELKAKVCPCCEEPFPEPEVNLKNLTTKAYQETHHTLMVVGITTDLYTAKSGNECNRITYHFQELFFERVVEYYVISSYKARMFLQNRLSELEVGEVDFDKTPSYYTVEPIAFDIVKDGRYWRLV